MRFAASEVRAERGGRWSVCLGLLTTRRPILSGARPGGSSTSTRQDRAGALVRAATKTARPLAGAFLHRRGWVEFRSESAGAQTGESSVRSRSKAVREAGVEQAWITRFATAWRAAAALHSASVRQASALMPWLRSVPLFGQQGSCHLGIGTSGGCSGLGLAPAAGRCLGGKW